MKRFLTEQTIRRFDLDTVPAQAGLRIFIWLGQLLQSSAGEEPKN